MRLVAAALAACLSVPACAAESAVETVGLHGQATYVWQAKPGLHAAYSGPNSLRTEHERSYSFTATAAAGVRPWRDAEAYLDAEAVQGVPLSGLVGLGGLTNSELQKTGGPRIKVYRARAFLRQSWALSDERENIESDFNQLGGTQAHRRVVLTVGNLAVSDLFDDNRYAHDGRTLFLNWALLTHGHYDFAADSRGYSRGAALEWIDEGWAVRAGRFEVPKESNGLALDSRAGSRHGDQIELEHAHQLAAREGTLRLLWFRNVAPMGNFDEALADAAVTGAAPELPRVRRLQAKQGFGVALEQTLGDTLGGFVRLGRHDGKTEVYSFAAIDNALSAGLVWKGAAWQRADDQLGLAFASDGLSAAPPRFRAAGGRHVFVGDGRQRYGRETVLEAFYNLALVRGWTLALDLQHIGNPAYNRDRGPAQAVALRLHAEL